MGTNKTRYSYEIKPRPEHVGGGWRLRLLEDGEEVAGGAFPPGAEGYAEALAEADDWLSTRRWEGLPDDKEIQELAIIFGAPQTMLAIERPKTFRAYLERLIGCAKRGAESPFLPLNQRNIHKGLLKGYQDSLNLYEEFHEKR